MKTSRIVCALILALAPFVPAFGQALTGTSLSITGGGASTLSGNLTVSGTLGAVGTIDSASNTFIFGTQSGLDAVTLQYTDSSTDTLKFLINRSPASWAWVHNTNVTAMRLDSAHQLLLYNAAGTTAGITLTPVSNQISLGTATLTGSGTTLTAGGALIVASGITNTNGSLTGGASGLALSSGNPATNITLTAAGAGDIVFNTNGLERARIKSTGNVGIGTAAPAAKLTISGAIPGSGNRPVNGILFTTPNNPNVQGQIGLVQSTSEGNHYLLLQSVEDTVAWRNVVLARDGGNVGIGTMSPGGKLDVTGIPDNGSVYFRSTGRPFLAIEGGVNNYKTLRFSDAGGFRWDFNSLPGNDSANPQGFGIWSNAGQVLAITPIGNVGVGTASPTYGLSFGANIGKTVALYEGPGGANLYGISMGGNAAGGANPYRTKLHANGSEFMSITYAGTVGIGTTSPSRRLHVFDGTGVGSGVLIQAGYPYGAGVYPSILTLRDKDGAYDLFNLNSDGAFLFNRGPYPVLAGSAAGNIGIGTIAPAAPLHVVGNVAREVARFQGSVDVSNNRNFVSIYTTNPGYWWELSNQDPAGNGTLNGLAFRERTGAGSSIERVYFAQGGNVGIGTTAPTHKLSVKGTIRTQEIIVDNTNWADYVFDESYNLAPLSDVEAHIKAKKHLPGIPSAAEIAEHGVSMGDMQSKLLSKIEEITLHMIAQQKEIAALRQQVGELKASATP